jgi:acyl-CoA synthetase (AMP-forming)/AMP-acid ligase II
MSNIIDRDTIGDMARRAATKYGDKTAIIFRDTKISFYDLRTGSKAFCQPYEKLRN